MFCKCDKPRLGWIDADWEHIHCGYCDEVLGSWVDVKIRPRKVQIKVREVR